jgi:hypothetical protein
MDSFSQAPVAQVTGACLFPASLAALFQSPIPSSTQQFSGQESD